MNRLTIAFHHKHIVRLTQILFSSYFNDSTIFVLAYIFIEFKHILKYPDKTIS